MQHLNKYMRDVLRSIKYEEMKNSTTFLLTVDVLVNDLVDEYKKMTSEERFCFNKYLQTMILDKDAEIEEIKRNFIGMIIYTLSLRV